MKLLNTPILILTILCLASVSRAAGGSSAPAPVAQKTSIADLPVAGEPSNRNQKSGVKLEIFFESMDGAGWQWFFLGDAVRRRLPSVEMSVYPPARQER